MKKVLAVFAHPDDESFGPGGTIAKWIKEGAEVRLLCVTRGEHGSNDTDRITVELREEELRNAARILGISSVEYLGIEDGRICNHDLAEITGWVTRKIEEFRPDALLTFDLNGVSGHLDHMGVASAVTQAFMRTDSVERLYYFTARAGAAPYDGDYFVYRPEGKNDSDIDERIDVTETWHIKVEAMKAHLSQKVDAEHLLRMWSKLPDKKEYFAVKTKSQEK